MYADPTIVAPSAFAGLPTAVGSGRGLIATEREGLGAARIAARTGHTAEVMEHFRATFGIEPCIGPRRVSLGEVAIAGTGPNTWIATCENAGNAFAASLHSLLRNCASIADQSDAYVILRLTGPKVRETLAKLVPIDIHPRSFQVDDVAQTVCGYMSVTLWRLEDTAQGGPTFDMWAGRSFAVSLHQAIGEAAAEFGFVRYTA
jgi:methylglutamate dehydrogenase subunit D